MRRKTGTHEAETHPEEEVKREDIETETHPEEEVKREDIEAAGLLNIQDPEEIPQGLRLTAILHG